jgi:hypothetical protein
MAEDLDGFLKLHPHGGISAHHRDKLSAVTIAEAIDPLGGEGQEIGDPDTHPVAIVPKGLRAFDEHDSPFFQRLLPGPHDMHGLPVSLAFWKQRIESRQPEDTFAVGLMYGPSGCGKSSLVKAGLLPNLSTSVIAIYVEARGNETESQLLAALARRFPSSSQGDLRSTIRALRRNSSVLGGRKLLIVIDQFEQWLHAGSQHEKSDLVQALRQCDGVTIQSLVMVRDDFWMASTRFMRDVEIPLLEGKNSQAVDLFTIKHARRVLMEFGRSYGDLPHGLEDLTS